MSKVIELKAQIFDCLAVIENYTAKKSQLLQQLNKELQKEKDGQGTSIPDTAPSE